MKKVFFIHIPKCGGTSVGRAIKIAYFYSRIFRRKKGIESIYAKASNIGAEIFEEPLGVYRNKLAAYMLGQADNVVFMGHIPFDSDVYNRFSCLWDYVTILRNPVERWYSSFYYLRKRVPEQFPHEIPTDEFLNSSHAKLLGTTYIQFFSSASELYTANFQPEPNLDVVDLEQATIQAKENLKKFTLVGFLDNLDSFTKDFKSRFGKTLRIGHRNKNKLHNERRSEVNPEIHDRIVELCRFDIEIYNWAKKYFQEGQGND